ncbi:hypothetical protein [Vibrio anguillarum]|uniref:Uncharacterized protein n=1 Tax=Vibrio anguillarum TaxID=55601 RepID=A0A1Y0NXY9_VIBAN|nr:hypothetical protein [Vibrio anguillarum]AOT26290.1 hypothetical protein Her_0022 [Vibrio phage Her]AOT26381.1 hypothetical protein CLA_0022 [Vibrio phage Cla]AOT26563.1 hypothetical protein Pel_0022 [Vibrio phage Pel]AOT26654.1 hypothetical protein pVa2_0021 [Vibrio phage pVa-2]AOT26745.1 hypothetical protein pVa1_0022 [Vibrio phage pVa-1]AOT26836.1 hypothetical protein pVa5_0022 [Vibrio phage vB_VspP_pVa5_12Jun]AOT26927.1 hypothetical protein pVa6_0022 [Vibrio phage pVa-6]AOT27022.1 hy
METKKTEFGLVTISRPYFSRLSLSRVKSITLVKEENTNYGWGVSRELPENLTITPELINVFAKEASELI